MSEQQPNFEFASVDSTPRGLSHSVPIWYGPALIVLFCILSIVALLTVTTIPSLKQIFPSGDLVIGPYFGTHSISVRIFILCYFISYAAFSHANPLKKVIMGLDLCVFYIFFCVTFDMFTFLVDQLLGIVLPLTAIEILSGVIGFAVYSIKLMERGRMPETVGMTIDTSRNFQTITRALVVGIYCAWLSFYLSKADLELIETMRGLALLGGIGPGVFFFIPAFFVFLFLGGLIDQFSYRIRGFAPDISVVIPAHNEAHMIDATLNGIEVAAERYAGNVLVLVVDNASNDNTVEEVKRVAATLKHAKVKLLSEPIPGKSNALNCGLAAVQTDFFVRIDADTIVRKNAFRRGMTYFSDNEVGVVGGLPLAAGGGIFDRARFVECVVKHGLYSVGLAAINGLVGVPGMFAIFRTDLPRKLGGFVGGMNGEDTDMSLRIGELGYRLIIDPEVRYVSEVPRTYAHMREQRIRWFRSTYHVSARCRAVLFGKELTFRGKVILPYMLVNSARRAMMVPLICFGLIEFFGGFKTVDALEWQAVLAVVLGAPLIISALALIVNGYFLQLLYLPEYIIFRLLRSYFTLESNLSINLRLNAENLYQDENAQPQHVITSDPIDQFEAKTEV